MNSYSERAPVISGIPQDSVLGPILFVIYINDLPDNLKSECYMFADDTNVFKDINDIEDNKILQNDIQELENWSDKWLLRFHPDKCKVLSAGKQDSTVQVYAMQHRATILQQGKGHWRRN
jgi:hypothetical protein